MRKLFFIIIVIAMLNSLAMCSFGVSINVNALDFGSNLDPANSPFVMEPACIVLVDNTGTESVSTWTLRVRGESNFQSNGTPSKTIPISQLLIQGGDCSSYTPMSIANTIFETGGVGSTPVTTNYQLILNLANQPANDYSGTIIYTLEGL